MSWITRFLTSSIGRKIIMSLSGLFLIQFLLVHLIGNLQLLVPDGGKAFNLYAEMMATNSLIKTVSFLLYGSIILHAFQGLALWQKNKAAKASRYAVSASPEEGGTYSRNMAWFGIIILIFIFLHMWQFWAQAKILNTVGMVAYDGVEVKNVYQLVFNAFKSPVFVAVYVISMIVIGLHLKHGFWSSFQTLGLNHKKYTPLIKGLGLGYSILVPLGFAIIPIYMFLFA